MTSDFSLRFPIVEADFLLLTGDRTILKVAGFLKLSSFEECVSLKFIC